MLGLATDGGNMPRWAIVLRLYRLPKGLLRWLQRRRIGRCADCRGMEKRHGLKVLHWTPSLCFKKDCEWLCRRHSEWATECYEDQWAEEHHRQYTNAMMGDSRW